MSLKDIENEISPEVKITLPHNKIVRCGNMFRDVAKRRSLNIIKSITNP